MNNIAELCKVIASEQIPVPTWEILILLTIVSISMLLRAGKLGIFITYVFTLHLAWSFMKLHFNMPVLITFAVLGGVVLLLGIISVMKDR